MQAYSLKYSLEVLVDFCDDYHVSSFFFLFLQIQNSSRDRRYDKSEGFKKGINVSGTQASTYLSSI